MNVSPNAIFEYFDPATVQDIPCGRMEKLGQLEPAATGDGIVAVNPVGETFMFLEILLE